MHLADALQPLLIALLLSFLCIPLLMRRVRLPRTLQFEMLAPEALSPRQAEYLAARDVELRELGYEPFATYRVTNLSGRNLLRTYFHPADTARCTVILLSTGKSISQQAYLEFNTEFADGTRLATRNAQITGIFKRMPNSFLQEYRDARNATELKRRHDRRAETLFAHGPIPLDPSQFFAIFQQEHAKLCDYQVEHRLLRFDLQHNLYYGTPLIALRGIANFFNPFADTFTPLRLIAGLLFGAGLPVIVVCYPRLTFSTLQPLLQALAGHGIHLSFGAVVLGAYIVAGVAVGLLFRQKIFIWSFLLGLVPMLLMRNSAGQPLIFMSVIMAWSGEVAFRLRARTQRLI